MGCIGCVLNRPPINAAHMTMRVSVLRLWLLCMSLLVSRTAGERDRASFNADVSKVGGWSVKIHYISSVGAPTCNHFSKDLVDCAGWMDALKPCMQVSCAGIHGWKVMYMHSATYSAFKDTSKVWVGIQEYDCVFVQHMLRKQLHLWMSIHLKYIYK